MYSKDHFSMYLISKLFMCSFIFFFVYSVFESYRHGILTFTSKCLSSIFKTIIGNEPFCLVFIVHLASAMQLKALLRAQESYLGFLFPTPSSPAEHILNLECSLVEWNGQELVNHFVDI